MEPLTFPENVHRRPGMYVGDVDTEMAALNLVYEVLSNAVDEHLAGRATRIDIEVSAREALVVDNGAGFDPDSGSRPQFDVFTDLHFTGTRDGHSPHVHCSPALRGIGLAVVCALSDSLSVETAHGGLVHRRTYQLGKRLTSSSAPAVGEVGTKVKIRLANSFVHGDIPVNQLAEHVRELSFMLPGCRLTLNGIEYPGGELEDFCLALAQTPLVCRPLHTRLTLNEVLVDVSIGWKLSNLDPPTVRAYVSTSRCRGGTPMTGLFAGLHRGLRSSGIGPVRDSAASRERVGRGLVAVVHVGLYAPKWGDPTKERLDNPAAHTAVSNAIKMALPAYLAQYPSVRTLLSSRYS